MPTLPMIIASDLTHDQKAQLVGILKVHKKAIGWTIADLKGINPSICMHHIYYKAYATSYRDMQKRLNPNMKEMVKNGVG